MNKKIVSIAAGEVKVGDHIYNHAAYCRKAEWLRVKSVESRGDYTLIHTDVWTTSKHRREGIAVQREEPHKD